MLEAISAAPKLISRDGVRLTPLAYLFLLILSIAFFAPGLASLPPTDRDESSFAQATKQMIETGNYVDIRLQNKPRYQKPIGIYWLQAASVKLFDPAHLSEIWAYRLPSFASAIIAVLATAALGSLLFNPLTGLTAAVMLASCVSLNIEAHLAKTDATLLACIMLMQYALARAYKKILTGWAQPLLFWSALGLGILVKGPIICLVLFSTLLWLYFTEGRQLQWFKALRPIVGIILLLLLIAPWFTAIILTSHGQFVEKSAGQDMLGKLWQGQGRGIIPPGAHFIVFQVMFFPFSLFALLGLVDSWRNRAQPAVGFCLGWIIPTWIVFELSLTKLPHYVLPTYPAIAMLAAKALLDGYPAVKTAVRRWPTGLAVACWLLVGGGYAVAFFCLPYFLDHTIGWAQAIVGLLLILAQSVALLLLLNGRSLQSVAVLSGGFLVFLCIAMGSTLPGMQSLWLTRNIVNAANVFAPCRKLDLSSVGYSEPSLVFMAGTNTLIRDSGELVAQDLLNDPCRMAIVDNRHQADFIAGFPEIRQPLPVAHIAGINTGSKGERSLSLYVMQPASPQP